MKTMLVFMRINGDNWLQLENAGGKWIGVLLSLFFRTSVGSVIVFFSGSQKLNINAGGRIAIPTKYRDEIVSDEFKGQMYLTSHLFDKCLVLYPKAKFNELSQQIRDTEDAAQASIYNKVIIAPAVETEMDGQGRIMIPPALREIAEIEKEVALIGQVESFQIWNASSWDDDFYDAREQAKELRNSGEVRLKL